MQNKQYELCLAVLRRLQEASVLQHLVLIGSWCLPLYQDYFKDVGDLYPVKTRDIDFLVPRSGAFPTRVSVPDLLKDLGFITGFRGEKGCMVLEHPELMIEFLVPERGRGNEEVRDIPALGMNAQPLRFLDVALKKTMCLRFEDIPVIVPHPAAFALHKLLVAPRRRNVEKRRKDTDSALIILDLIAKKRALDDVRDLMRRFPRTWRNTILSALGAERREDLARSLTGNGRVSG